jgi:hypothetical protein
MTKQEIDINQYLTQKHVVLTSNIHQAKLGIKNQSNEEYQLSTQDKQLLDKLKVKFPASKYLHVTRYSGNLDVLWSKEVLGYGSPHENETIHRLCVSTQIDLCLLGLQWFVFDVNSFNEQYENEHGRKPDYKDIIFYKKVQPDENNIFYVYEVYPSQSVYKPTNKEVIDASITNEHWLLESEKHIKCIGQIKVTESIRTQYDPKYQIILQTPRSKQIFQYILAKYIWLKRF